MRPTSSWSVQPAHGRLQQSIAWGKLDIGRDAVARFDELVALDGFSHLPVSYLHALRAGGLLSEHRDPFDRMLAAQSLIEGIPLVTRDAAFDALGTATIW